MSIPAASIKMVFIRHVSGGILRIRISHPLFFFLLGNLLPPSDLSQTLLHPTRIGLVPALLLLMAFIALRFLHTNPIVESSETCFLCIFLLSCMPCTELILKLLTTFLCRTLLSSHCLDAQIV